MTEVVPAVGVEVQRQPRGRRLAGIIRRLRESVEPPFPQASEYIGPPEPRGFVMSALSKALGIDPRGQY